MPAGVSSEQRVDERLRGFEDLSFGGQVLMVLRARFVLKYFTVDFVDEQVNRGVKILFRGLAVNILAADMQGNFCSVLEWFERQDDLRADNVVKMSQNTGHFGLDVFPDGWGDVKMVTGDIQVH